LGKTNATTSTQAFVEGSPVDILLFGFKTKRTNLQTSFNASASTDSNSGYAHVPEALKHLIKTCNIFSFEIATVGPDGRRLYSEENVESAGGINNLSQEAQL